MSNEDQDLEEFIEEDLAEEKEPLEEPEIEETDKLIEEISTLKQKVDQGDREIQALIEYQKRTSQREYEKAKQELESKLAASKDDMDVENVAIYTKELTKLESVENQNQSTQRDQEKQDAKQSFMERNQHWFNDRNQDLVNRAVEIDNQIIKDINEGKLSVNSFNDIGTMIEKRLAYEYPDRVLNEIRPSRISIPSNQSSINKTAVNKSKTFQSLSQELKDTYTATKRIIESRGDEKYTQDDFLEQLKRDGEING